MTYLTSQAYKIMPTLKRFLITTMMFRNCNKITCEVCCLPWHHWHGFEPLSYTIYLAIFLQYLPSQKSVPKNISNFCKKYVTLTSHSWRRPLAKPLYKNKKYTPPPPLLLRFACFLIFVRNSNYKIPTFCSFPAFQSFCKRQDLSSHR